MNDRPRGHPRESVSEMTLIPGVSASSGHAFITIEWRGITGQQTPKELRRTAMDMFAVAEAAEMDAALVAWLRHRFKFSTADAAVVLAELREYRYAEGNRDVD